MHAQALEISFWCGNFFESLLFVIHSSNPIIRLGCHDSANISTHQHTLAHISKHAHTTHHTFAHTVDIWNITNIYTFFNKIKHNIANFAKKWLILQNFACVRVCVCVVCGVWCVVIMFYQNVLRMDGNTFLKKAVKH